MGKLLKYFCLLICVCAAAQSPYLDSLRRVAASAPSDTTRIKKLNHLAWELRKQGLYDEGLTSAGEALRISERLDFGWGLINSHNILGLLYSYKGNYPLALANQIKSLQYAERFKWPFFAGNALSNIGNVYQLQGNYEKALEYQLKALHLRQQIIATGGTHLDSLAIANSWGNTGIIYTELGKLNTALGCHRRSLELMRKAGGKIGEANALNNMATCYLDQDSLHHALFNFHEALKIYRETGYLSGEGTSLSNLAETYLRLNNMRQAERYALESMKLADKSEEPERLVDAHLVLYNIYEKKGRYDAALLHYRKYISALDQLRNEENTKRSVQIEMQYEFDKKEAAARLEQEKRDAVAAAEARRQRIILSSISGFGLLVLAFAVFAYRSFLRKKRTNIEIIRQKQIIEQKQKEILDSIQYARRIQQSLLPSEKYLKRVLSERVL